MRFGLAAHRSVPRGFTLVELMIVVAIVSILATIAGYGVSRYLAASKTGEAVQMIGAIKAAQESYKDETFQYLNVSGNLSTFYPTNARPGRNKVSWGAGTDAVANNWRTLGISPTGPVLFVYSCTAGSAATNVVSPGADITIGNWPTALGQPWYVIKAVADLDGSGDKPTVFVGSSFTTELFSAGDGS